MTLGRQRLVAAAGVLVAMIVLAACTSGTTSGSPSSRPSQGVSSSPAIAAVQADLRAAVHATSWPNITPAFTQPADKAQKDNRGCTWDAVNPPAQCTWGNPAAQHTLYLVGDSTSAAYLPAFATFIDQLPSWKMVVRSDSGCPFSTMPAPEGSGLDPDAGSAACTEHDEKVVAEILSARPDLVVFTTVSGAAARIPGKQDELARIQGAVGRIVVLPTSPPIKNPVQCDVAGSTPADCVTPIPKAYHQWLVNLRAVATSVKGVFLDPTSLFCVDGQCPVFVKTIPRTDDGVHMTPTYAAYLGPAVHELFQEDHLLP